MDPGVQLLLIIALIYLSDCLWWIPHTGWMLAGRWPDGLRASFSGALGNTRGGFRFLFPLPGLGVAFEIQECPISRSTEGWSPWLPFALTHNGRTDRASTRFRFGQEGALPRACGHELVRDGKLLVDTRSASSAQLLTAQLQELTAADPASRAALLEGYWKKSISVEALRARVTQTVDASRGLRITGLIQFLCMFALAPGLVHFHGLSLGLLEAASAVFLMALVNATLFVRGHRLLYPEARRERWKLAAIMVVSFPMSARAADLLTRKALLAFEAPVVVASLCSPEANRALMQRWFRDLCHPLRFDGVEGEEQDFLESCQNARRERWCAWWQTPEQRAWREQEPPQLPPERRICPRCLMDFTSDINECPDCPGIRLLDPKDLNHA